MRFPAAAFLLSMVRAPESPRFLIQAGKTEEGFAVLEHIIGTEQARLRTDDIHASVKLETEMSHEFHDLFRPRAAEGAHHRHFDQGVNAALRYCIAMLPCCRVIASLRCHVATSHCIAALLRCRITYRNTNAATQ